MIRAFEMKVGGKFTHGTAKFRVTGKTVFSADGCHIIVPVEGENRPTGMLALPPFAVVEDYEPPGVESVEVSSMFGETSVRFSWYGGWVGRAEGVTIAHYRGDTDVPDAVVVVEAHDLRTALEEFGLYGERG